MWIDANERLPEELEMVLVYTPEGVFAGARYEGGWEVQVPQWDAGVEYALEVLHWMPLPEAPCGTPEAA